MWAAVLLSKEAFSFLHAFHTNQTYANNKIEWNDGSEIANEMWPILPFQVTIDENIYQKSTPS